MANKDLRYFMREEAKVEQIVTVPGPESIKDENGKVIQLEIKQLHNDTIAKINEMYESKTPLKDKNSSERKWTKRARNRRISGTSQKMRW